MRRRIRGTSIGCHYIIWTCYWRSPIINELGQAETSVGLQRFNVHTRDIGKSDQVGADEAFMYKEVFTGSYSAEPEF